MKNVHVIPTEKASTGYILGKCIKELSDVKIGQFVKTHYMMFDKEYFQPQNIYITSYEEIKDGDWILEISDNSIFTIQIQPNTNLSKYKKVILTTDQDLIASGVQAIDDEFLEWFVKNPSCEYVKITKDKIRQDKEFNDISHWNIYEYKIVIPQEEPKQETLEEAAERLIQLNR